MAKSPTQRWGEWVPATSTTVALTSITREGREALVKDGFQVPPRVDFEDALTANLEPVTRYHFSHFLNLVATSSTTSRQGRLISGVDMGNDSGPPQGCIVH